jgi:hypothetical protein
MKTHTILLVMAATTAIIATVADGQPCCVTQANGYGGGTGTATDPYQICAPAHIAAIPMNLSAHFIQTNDISMAGINHVPIGTFANPFTGNFNGQGHRISGLGINSGALPAAGLFGVVGPAGVVSDVVLPGVNINAVDNVGALVGENQGTVERCSANGMVQGRDFVGGLVGDCNGGTIDACFAGVNVTGRNGVGGLVGLVQMLATVKDAYARGSATANTANAGGLVGSLFFSAVENAYAVGPVTAPAGAGGLVGNAAGGAVTDSFWNMVTSGQAASAGGVGQTTMQMLTLATFDPPWDFAGTWTMLEGEDYPRLKWDRTAPPPVGEQDLDGDGVRDDHDRCLNTVGGVAVGIHGCPDPMIPFDTDLDGDLDVVDWEALQFCSRGPAVAAPVSCAPITDLNDDTFADLREFAAFQRCFTGAGVPGDPGCAGIAGATLAIPPIQVAMGGCTLPVPNFPDTHETAFDRHFHRVTLTDPRAISNDGTPAVMFVRQAPAGSPNADRWLIWFQGGGGCRDYESCSIRWCGLDPPYDAGLMSSRWEPVTRDGVGHLRPCLPNWFHDYNHVFLKYVSSDNCSGQNGRVVLTSEGGQQYSLYFNGHYIIEAAMAVLDAGAVSDDGQVTMPSILDAIEICNTGTSAGGGSSERHADWIAARYPSAVHYFVRDASPTPRTDLLTGAVPSGMNCAPGQPLTWEDLAQSLENITRDDFYARALPNWNPFADESCIAYLPPEEHWKCGTAYGTFNHITTPMFIRMDLQDTVNCGSLLTLGLCSADLPVLTRPTLLEMANIPTTAVEASQISVVPGAFGPWCGIHEGLNLNTQYFGVTVEDALGNPVTLNDAIRQWMNGNTVSVVDFDDPLLRTTDCP